MDKMLWDVVIEADEPWHDGLRQRVADAVATFTDSRIERWQGMNLDNILAAYVHEYEGYAGNVHPSADGYVFSALERAQAFADHVRDMVGHEATVKVWRLDAVEDR